MYLIPELVAKPRISHYISTVEDGNMSFEFGERNAVLSNRKNFLEKIKKPVERMVALRVMHGTKIIEAGQNLAGTGIFSSETAIKADALITKEKNLGLFLLTADCIPAIFYDEDNKTVCLAHISRKNTEMGFSQIIVSLFKREYDASLAKLKIYFGPCIKKGSYILEEYPEGFDLVEENIQQLKLKGILRENIIVDPTDTAASQDFYSHYRDARAKKEEGRFATVVCLT